MRICLVSSLLGIVKQPSASVTAIGLPFTASWIVAPMMGSRVSLSSTVARKTPCAWAAWSVNTAKIV